MCSDALSFACANVDAGARTPVSGSPPAPRPWRYLVTWLLPSTCYSRIVFDQCRPHASCRSLALRVAVGLTAGLFAGLIWSSWGGAHAWHALADSDPSLARQANCAPPLAEGGCQVAGADLQSADEAEPTISLRATNTHLEGRAVSRIDVLVSNAQNVGAFDLQFSAAEKGVSLDERPFEKGPFLLRTGRQPYCLSNTDDPSSLRFTCVTLRQDPPVGADGSDVLASIYFKAPPSRSAIQFKSVTLTTPDGDVIPSRLASDTIDISPGGNGLGTLAFVLIAGAGIVVTVACVAGIVVVRRRLRRRGDSAAIAA